MLRTLLVASRMRTMSHYLPHISSAPRNGYPIQNICRALQNASSDKHIHLPVQPSQASEQLISKDALLNELHCYVETTGNKPLLLSGDATLTVAEWAMLAAKCSTDESRAVPSWLMRMFSQTMKYPKLGVSLVEFVVSQPKCHSAPLLVQCLVQMTYWPEHTTENYHEIFEQLWLVLEPLVQNDPLLSQTVMPRLVSALCKHPKQWRHALNYIALDKPDVTGSIRNDPSFYALVEAIVRWGSVEEMSSVLKPLADVKDCSFQSHGYSRFLPRSKGIVNALLSPNTSHREEKMFLLLRFLENNSLLVPDDSLEQFFAQLPADQWSVRSMNAVDGNMCNQCGTHLPSLLASNDDMSALADQWCTHVIKRDNIYYASSPEEFHKFRDFLQRYSKEKFQCVIDLPNYVLSLKRNVDDIRNFMQRLKRQYNVERVLFCSKNGIINSVDARTVLKVAQSIFGGRNVITFITNITSHDDIYSVYAALWSGLQCYLVSNDEFRAEKSLLPHNSSVSTLFLQWQLNRQFHFPNKSIMIAPRKYILRVKQHGSSLDDPQYTVHIPILNKVATTNDREESNSERYRASSYHPPHRWLCVSRKL